MHAHFQLGYLLQSLERYTEAENAYRKVIQLDPSNASAYNNLGSNLIFQKRNSEADVYYRKATKLNSAFPEAYIGLGRNLIYLKHYPEADAAFRKAIELKPSESTFYLALGLNLEDNLKKFDEAITAYQKAIELDPSTLYAYTNLGHLLWVLGRIEEALPVLKKATERDSNNFVPLIEIASIYKSIGNDTETKEYAEKSRTLIPNDESYWYNQTCVDSIAGNIDAAFMSLTKAVDEKYISKEWAWQDRDLQWIRDDPRFIEIVGPKPKNENSEV